MDTFNRDTDYRPLGHDIPWVYNLTALYDIPGFRRSVEYWGSCWAVGR